MSRVRGTVDVAGVAGRLARRAGVARKGLAEAVLRDSTGYVPRRTGALARSGKVVGDGDGVVWGIGYARKVYAGDGPGARWFERAKAAHGEAWVREVKRGMGE